MSTVATADKDSAPSGFLNSFVLTGHEDSITALAWSPDGSRLASASMDRTIRIWDIATRRVLHTLHNYTHPVRSITWSPNGKAIASGSDDHLIRVWEIATERVQLTLSGHRSSVYSICWASDMRTLISASWDTTIRLWDVRTGNVRNNLTGHFSGVSGIALSPKERLLASCSHDKTIQLWDVLTGKKLAVLADHADTVRNVKWSPNNQSFVSCSDDKTIRVWDTKNGQLTHVLEGHTGSIFGISFTPDGRLLASKSRDGTIRIWRCDTFEVVAILSDFMRQDDTPTWLDEYADGDPSFNPIQNLLSTIDGSDSSAIRIQKIDINLLSKAAPVDGSFHYTNAKVVLLGDTGVGKSALGQVLINNLFEKTDSTHGRRVNVFRSYKASLESGLEESRETFLWDLAGQAGYRLIHQLHLNEVSVAVVVFDARSEIDPFAGARYWMRALSQAEKLQLSRVGYFPAARKFLVAARVDRGGIGVSRERIEKLRKDLGFDEYIETSARDGIGIIELRDAIHDAIPWAELPHVTSTTLFYHIKIFLINEVREGRLLISANDLYQNFCKKYPVLSRTPGLEIQFEIGKELAETHDIIRRLKFGSLVLLKPELLDSYAAALINTAREEPDGVGSISEEDAINGQIRLSDDERIKDGQEKLLLIATIDDLLYHEIAIREHGEDGSYLVFPSALTRERPDLPEPEGKTVVFTFEGPLLNIYATLVVRLTHSGVFRKEEFWKNAATYNARVGGICGVFMNQIDEGRGEITIFFDKIPSEETRFQFEEYVYTHLQRRAVPESIKRRRIFICPTCDALITHQVAVKRRERGFNWLSCSVCETRIELYDREERLPINKQYLVQDIVQEIDHAADIQRTREIATTVIQGKRATKNFDVFLCHNNIDKDEVKQIGQQLKEYGILSWLDDWELRPGLSWQRLLSDQIEQIKTVAIFVGKDGIGPWQQQEIDAVLHEFVKRECRVIPVILSSAPHQPELPIFLRGVTWVDFHRQKPDPIKQLVWGITGMRGGDFTFSD